MKYTFKKILICFIAIALAVGAVNFPAVDASADNTNGGHISLVSGSGLDHISIIDQGGNTVWSISQSNIGWVEVNDADLLPNGNVVFAARANTGSTVYMLRPDYPNTTGYEIVWTYEVPAGAENHTSQALPDGGVLIGEAYSNYVRIVELDSQGNLRKTLGSAENPLPGLPVGSSTHNQIRQIHKTSEGTYLVASMSGTAKTVEYSQTGEKIAEYPAGGFTAVKDASGNVIVAGGSDLHITCFSGANGSMLWQIGQEDLPDVSLAFIGSLNVLENGNIVFANWGGHEGSVIGNAVLEITVPTAQNPTEIVWSLDSGKNTSNVHIVDQIDKTVFDGQKDNGGYVGSSGTYRSPIDLVGSMWNNRVYVADETNNTVDVIDNSTGRLIDAIPVTQKPNTLILSHDGKVLYVATGGAYGRVEAYSTVTHIPLGCINVGHTPSALALSDDGETIYVANRFNGTVQAISLTSGAIANGATASAGVYVTREPMSMAIKGEKLYVGGHLPTGDMTDDSVSSEVAVINTSDMTVAKIITMASGSTNLKDIALSPDGEYLYVSHVLGRWNVATTHVDRGWIYTNAVTEIRTSDDTVRATMLVDDLDLGAANPWGIDVNSDTIVLSISGTRELMVLNRTELRKKIEAVWSDTIGGNGFLETPDDIALDLTFTTEFKQRVKLGEDGPRGIEILGKNVYVANYYSGSISVYDLTTRKTTLINLPTAKVEDDIRAGERLWNDATLCMGQWLSCASCHPDARTDALNWDNMNDGIGTPKQARSMVGAWYRGRVMATGIRPSAYAANRAGMKYICFNDGFPESEMIKIDAYVASLVPEVSPYLENGRLSESAARGKALFNGKANCASCHSGDLYGADFLVYDNYTQSTTETRGLLVPPLIEAWRTGPYLHDGSAATIMDVLTTRNVTGTHGNATDLTEEELVDLCNYVLTIGSEVDTSNCEHNVTLVEGYGATCTDDGVMDCYLCLNCGSYFADNNCTTEINYTEWKNGAGRIPSEHRYGALVQKEPQIHTQTELKAGMNAYYVCSECGSYFDENKVKTTLDALVIPEPQHTFGEWINDNEKHWKVCTCGLRDSEGEHSYTDAADMICNDCDYDRSTLHQCGNGTKQNGRGATCTVDGWNDYYKCSCGRLYADMDCESEITSLEEWKNGAGRIAATHTYGDLVDRVEPTCMTTGKYAHYKCSVCGTEFDENKEVKTATELAIPIDSTAHDHTDEWKSDESGHWNECICGNKANRADHTDTDNNGKCDACDYTLKVKHDCEQPPKDDSSADGVDGGVVVGIVIGAVAVISIGGFALVWFVIKKKSLADLIAIFKK